MRRIWGRAAFYIYFSLSFYLLSLNLLRAEEPAVDLPPITTAAKHITLGGQGRIRYQSFPAPKTNEVDFFTNYRFRLNVDVTLIDGVSFFFQPQKVGVFGNGETGATTDQALTTVQTTPATGAGTGVGDFTLHQGYLRFEKVGALPLDLQAGRFEYIIGGARLIGNGDWNQRARSFDGGVARLHLPQKSTFDLFAIRLTGEKETGSLPTGDADNDTDLLGAYFATEALPWNLVEVTLLNDRKLPALPDSSRFTGGIKIEQTPSLSPYPVAAYPTGPYWRGEYYYQWGDQSAKQKIRASLYAARIGYRLDVPTQPTLVAGWEHLSGDDDTTKGRYQAFNNLYGTAHGYYGFMDYFDAFPADTAGLGLRDAFIRLQVTPWADGAAGVDLHDFALATGVAGQSKKLGREVDATLVHQLNKFTSAMIGYSYFFAETGAENLFTRTAGAKGIKPDENGQWGYAMVNLVF